MDTGTKSINQCGKDSHYGKGGTFFNSARFQNIFLQICKAFSLDSNKIGYGIVQWICDNMLGVMYHVCDSRCVFF